MLTTLFLSPVICHVSVTYHRPGFWVHSSGRWVYVLCWTEIYLSAVDYSYQLSFCPRCTAHLN